MDRLIHDLYTKNIIEIKKTKLKNELNTILFKSFKNI